MQILTVFKLSFMAISSLSSYLQGLKFSFFYHYLQCLYCLLNECGLIHRAKYFTFL